MDKKPDDGCIAAVATAPGRGGIGVVRVSGREAAKIALAVLGKIPEPRRATYIDFLDGDGTLIDRGIALYFPAPHSYTGEDVLELQGHGGNAVMQRLLQRCIQLGARLAEPGEFTRRAYLNDKLDLVQAEAVADLIEASSVQAAQSAMRSLAGDFSQKIQHVRSKLIDLRLFVEACLDFPEEDIDFIAEGNIAQKLAGIETDVQAILAGASQGKLLREGIRVVLVGQPNVGKSSLMNLLSGDEVAIVTPVAGTTRDVLKNEIHIQGIPIHILDTAGLRETDDEVERAGIARTWLATESAQVALILVDASHGIGEEEKSILGRLGDVSKRVWIHNKIDLSKSAAAIRTINGETHIHLSAKTGDGIDLLRNHLLQLAGWQANGEGVFMARERHLVALKDVILGIQRSSQQMGQAELLAEDLRIAQESLNRITGEFTADDLLGEIFGRFCIGK